MEDLKALRIACRATEALLRERTLGVLALETVMGMISTLR